jgi:hypothetical protein
LADRDRNFDVTGIAYLRRQAGGQNWQNVRSAATLSPRSSVIADRRQQIDRHRFSYVRKGTFLEAFGFASLAIYRISKGSRTKGSCEGQGRTTSTARLACEQKDRLDSEYEELAPAADFYA